MWAREPQLIVYSLRGVEGREGEERRGRQTHEVGTTACSGDPARPCSSLGAAGGVTPHWDRPSLGPAGRALTLHKDPASAALTRKLISFPPKEKKALAQPSLGGCPLEPLRENTMERV